MSLPATHVEQAWQSAEFYTNKIMMEFRNSEPAHVDWVKSLKALLTALGDFVKKHHVAGPAWNPSGPPVSQFQPGAGINPSDIVSSRRTCSGVLLGWASQMDLGL